MVQDNVTGLIWEVKQDKDDTPNYTNPHDADNTSTWYDVSSGIPEDGTDTLDFIAALNSSQFGGYSDWRLPTVNELSYLVDRNSVNPSINTIYFPNTVSSFYWSSTTYAKAPFYALYVLFNYGYVNYNYKSFHYYVRAVRGGQCGSFDNFVDNGDGTVTNTDTGLMWQQDTAPETYTWQEALSYCENLSLADYTDWRLPNINELQSLVDYACYAPAINTTYFPNTESSSCWSSTTGGPFGGPFSAWNVGFYLGGVYDDSKSVSIYVRAVRAGQCRPFDSSTTTVASTTTTISGSTTTAISGSTTTTSVQPCFSEQIYGEYSTQTELLRYLRDNVLSQTPEGRELIRLYYELSPVIVEIMQQNEEFKKQVKEMIDGVLELIGKEVE